MITAETVKYAVETISAEWKEDGDKVLEAVFNTNTTYMSTKEFLDNCECCGGNWGGMLLTGIQKLYPTVWEAIPNIMGESGTHAFNTICCVLTLLGIDTSI